MNLVPITPPPELYGRCFVCGAACYKDSDAGMIRCSECPNAVSTYNWSRTPSPEEIAERAAEIREKNLGEYRENKSKSACVSVGMRENVSTPDPHPQRIACESV